MYRRGLSFILLTMPAQNKQEQNEQFYKVLKEILDTQSAIVSKMDSIDKKLDKLLGEEKPDLKKLWSQM